MNRSIHEEWADIAGALELMDVHRNLLPLLAERFEAGAREHGDDWGKWPLERFASEVVEEHMDILLYIAMATVTHGSGAIHELRMVLEDFASGEVE